MTAASAEFRTMLSERLNDYEAKMLIHPYLRHYYELSISVVIRLRVSPQRSSVVCELRPGHRMPHESSSGLNVYADAKGVKIRRIAIRYLQRLLVSADPRRLPWRGARDARGNYGFTAII